MTEVRVKSDLPRRKVMALINSYGPDVLDMSGTVASELHQACPGHCDEVEGLVAALQHGVVHYLLVLAEAGKKPSEGDLAGQVARLGAEAGLSQADAQQAVSTWADIVSTIHLPSAAEPAWRHEPKGMHQPYYGLREVLIVGIAGLTASMLPWLIVLEERRGHHFMIPAEMDSLAAHTCLNLLGAAGGFLGGALGWMLGAPRSLDSFANRGGTSTRRLVASSAAAAFGSFFGLWVGYHHVADLGAFFGPLVGAGVATFLATVYTFKFQPMRA